MLCSTRPFVVKSDVGGNGKVVNKNLKFALVGLLILSLGFVVGHYSRDQKARGDKNTPDIDFITIIEPATPEKPLGNGYTLEAHVIYRDSKRTQLKPLPQGGVWSVQYVERGTLIRIFAVENNEWIRGADEVTPNK
jgi:hypothetical protein